MSETLKKQLIATKTCFRRNLPMCKKMIYTSHLFNRTGREIMRYYIFLLSTIAISVHASELENCTKAQKEFADKNK